MTNWQRIKNGELDKEIFWKRAKIIRAIRDFFWQKDFLEVETPEAVGLPGQEPYLEIFDTEVRDDRGKNFSASLITSPEYAMKKLLAAGYQNIFQITKAFRNNESFGGAHNPEFTILEWYRQNASYVNIMKDTEELVCHVLTELGLPKIIEYQGTKIDFSAPWERITVAEAMKKYADVENLSYEMLFAAAKRSGYKITNGEAYDSVFFKIFLNEVENKFDPGLPVILYDYPAELAALAKRKDGNPSLAERFEVYAGGLELANAFGELLDADEQKARFLEEQKLRAAEGKKVYPIDEDFIEALRAGVAPSGGIALGVDRLVMLLTNQKNIEDVIFFPAKELFKK
jgi:lysyl-tRNA synthetase class 2